MCFRRNVVKRDSYVRRLLIDRLRMVMAFANVRHLLYLQFDRSNTVLMGTFKEVASANVCRFVSKAPLLWSMD